MEDQMLNFIINKMLKSRLISQPVGFLTHHGMPRQTANRLISGRFKNLTAKQLEKLCLALKCTPNDLLEWIPDEEKILETNPPLKQLIRAEVPYQLKDIAKDIPFEKLSEFAGELEQLKKKYI